MHKVKINLLGIDFFHFISMQLESGHFIIDKVKSIEMDSFRLLEIIRPQPKMNEEA